MTAVLMATGIVVVLGLTLVGILLFPRGERPVPYTVDRLQLARSGREAWINRELAGIEAAQAVHDAEGAAGEDDPADIG